MWLAIQQSTHTRHPIANSICHSTQTQLIVPQDHMAYDKLQCKLYAFNDSKLPLHPTFFLQISSRWSLYLWHQCSGLAITGELDSSVPVSTSCTLPVVVIVKKWVTHAVEKNHIVAHLLLPIFILGTLGMLVQSSGELTTTCVAAIRMLPPCM